MIKILNQFILSKFVNNTTSFKTLHSIIYNERQKYGINSLKIKQIFFQKNLWTGRF
jgi:hypothetical protein